MFYWLLDITENQKISISRDLLATACTKNKIHQYQNSQNNIGGFYLD